LPADRNVRSTKLYHSNQLTLLAARRTAAYHGRPISHPFHSGVPVIEAVNLQVRYGSVEALKGVSFRVKPGEICGYLGPNGAGKTTTVKALTGILKPNAGTVRICGRDMALDPVEGKRRLGYVPETAAAFSLLTPREYLGMLADLHELDYKIAEDRRDKLLHSFGITDLADRRIDTLSKGQRQRVVLSAALLHDPDVLFLDEPLSGLDATAARTVKELIAGLAEQGRAVLFCSHVLEVVERVCTRVIVLHQGSIVADAPTGELMARASDASLEAVFRRLTSANEPDAAVHDLLEALRPTGGLPREGRA
jgi:ABC-2 type transport system ATP-binding protein